MKTKYVFDFCHSFLKIDLNCDKMLPNLRSFIKRQTSDTSSDNVWQRVKKSGITSDTNDNEWYNEWQRVVQRVVQRVATNDSEWKRMTMSRYFGQFSFFSREDSTNRHPNENPLNFEEDFEEDLLN